MRVIASFDGRGIDVHNVVTTRKGVLDGGLIRNLVDGVRTGRVRWFTVVGAGADVFGDLADALEDNSITWSAVSLLAGEHAADNLERVNRYNALRADGAHEEAAEEA